MDLYPCHIQVLHVRKIATSIDVHRSKINIEERKTCKVEMLIRQ
jgi:hypothetical protein